MKNVITQTAHNLNLVVSAVTVEKMNDIIFSTKYLSGLGGNNIVKDGDKVFKIDTVSNTSAEITPTTLAASAEAGLLALTDKNSTEVDTAISFGLVKKVVMIRGDGATNGYSEDISTVAKNLGLKVVDVTVQAQDDIIFQAQGITQLDGLDNLDGKYYKLDTVKNTATLINPDGIAKDAKDDILKGKQTDLVSFVLRYNLISELTLGVKSSDD